LKILNIIFLVIFLTLLGACSVRKSSDIAQDNKTEASTVYADKVSTEKYVQVLDELISNGCNISSFEMVERSKALDMKVSCK